MRISLSLSSPGRYALTACRSRAAVVSPGCLAGERQRISNEGFGRTVCVPSSAVEAEQIVDSPAHWPWLLLTHFPLCPVLPVLLWQKVLEPVRSQLVWG